VVFRCGASSIFKSAATSATLEGDGAWFGLLLGSLDVHPRHRVYTPRHSSWGLLCTTVGHAHEVKVYVLGWVATQATVWT